jgi:hypothetical protein
MSAIKFAFFSKPNKMFAKTSSSLIKGANFFSEFFSENIFKIITSVPGVDFVNLHFGRKAFERI